MSPHRPTPTPPSQARPRGPATTPDRKIQVTTALVGALIMAALLVAATPAVARSTQYTFTLTGRGWGHGVGMSQWGAYGYAKHGWKYKAILKHYYRGISLSPVGNPVVRVNLRSGRKAIKLTCPKDFTVRSDGATRTIAAGTTATTTFTGSRYRVVAGSLRETFVEAPVFKTVCGAVSPSRVGSTPMPLRHCVLQGKRDLVVPLGKYAGLHIRFEPEPSRAI